MDPITHDEEQFTEFTPYTPVPTEAPPKPADATPGDDSDHNLDDA